VVCKRRLRGAEQGQRAGAVRASAGDGDDEEPAGRAARRLRTGRRHADERRPSEWRRSWRGGDERRARQRAGDNERRRGRGLRRGRPARRRRRPAATATTRLHRPGHRPVRPAL